MFRRQRKHVRLDPPEVRITIYRGVLDSIYGECDRYEVDETGGRIIGFYQLKSNRLEIEVSGVIEPGPHARRTRTSFFQDGEYQEGIFRRVEVEHSNIEHLGNWHTHHVNGLDTLSSGDIATYTRTVNHKSHNTGFFYALLVVAKMETSRNRERYAVRHFIFYRDNPSVYEIPTSQITILDKPTVWPEMTGRILGTDPPQGSRVDRRLDIQNVRVRDKQVLFEMYPDIRPFLSKRTGSVYWRGKLDLIDDSSIEVFVLETKDDGAPTYSIALVDPHTKRFRVNERYRERIFESARRAIWAFERELNREILNVARKTEM